MGHKQACNNKTSRALRAGPGRARIKGRARTRWVGLGHFGPVWAGSESPKSMANGFGPSTAVPDTQLAIAGSLLELVASHDDAPNLSQAPRVTVEAVFARRQMGGATLRVCRPRLQKRCDGRRKTRSIVPCTDQHHPSRSPLSLSLSYGFVRLKMSKCTFLIGIRSSRDPRIRPRPLLQLTSLSAGGRGRGSAERVKAEAVSLPPEGMGWE